MASQRVGPLVALAGLGCVAALTLARVFENGSFVVPVLGAVIAAHGIGAAARWRKWSPVAGELAALVGLWLYLAWSIEGHTTAYGVPTGDTMHALARDLSAGFTQLRTAVSPAAVTSGLLLLATGGAYLCAHLSDWAATRLDATIQAVIPPFVFFIVASALGTDRLRGVTTAGFLFLALLFVLTQSASLQSRATAWASSARRARGPMWLLASGLPVIAVVVLVAVTAGPRVPGADAAPLVRWKGVGTRGDVSRQTISPLVDLKPRLTQNPSIELFTVQSSEAHNWRVTALDAFDGRTWTSVGTYKAAKGTLFKERADRAPTVPVRQTFEISALDSFWLPAAYRPVRIDLKGARVHPESLTLLTDKDSAIGLVYTVDSAVPAPTAAQLNEGVLDAGFQRFTQLPVDFPPAVRTLAQRIVASAKARTPFEQARALQDYLRTNYRYNENVRPGHSDSALLTFLFQTKQGYCEQFAGSFAAMARAVGLPTRVAVGFTPGHFDGSVFRVDSRNAHAWPEVHLGGFGWVPFEPTPGRFELTESNFTGTFQPPVAAASNTTTTTAAADTDAATTPTTRPLDEDIDQRGLTSAARSPAATWLIRVGTAIAVVAGIVLAYTALVLSWKRRRRMLRQRGEPAERITGAWQEARERLNEAKLAAPPGATPSEYAQVVAAQRATLREPINDLAGLQTRASYAPAVPAIADADRAWAAVDGIVDVLDRDDTRTQRWRRRLDPTSVR